MAKTNRFRIPHAVTGILTALLLQAGMSLPVFAQEVHHFEIDTTDAATAIHQFGSQSGVQILASAEALNGKQLNKISGDLATDDGFEMLLAGTGLSHRYVGERAVALVSETPLPGSDPSRTPTAPQALNNPETPNPGIAGKAGFWDRVRLAQNSDEKYSDSSPSQGESRARSSEKSFEGPALEEVVVTAAKRSERIQDSSASIAVLGSQEISQRGLVSMNDYLRSVPGLNYVDRGVANNSIVIRGLTADAQNYTEMGGTVGIYLGDIPLAGLAVSGNNADIKLIDMERVEIIRGPQGTLFGDGSLGGAVRNIPAQPNFSGLHGHFKAGYSQTADEGGANDELQAVVNVPLVDDRLAVRAVGYRFQDSGYINNIAASNVSFSSNAAALGYGSLAVDQEDVGNSQYTGGRVTALWQPTEKLRASLMVLSQDLQQDGLPEVQLSLGTFEQTRLRIPVSSGLNQYPAGSERLTDDISLANLEIDYDLAWSTILSSTSYVEEQGLLVRDIGSFFGGIPTPQSEELTTRAFIEELRLTSTFEGAFQFLTGLYFNDRDKTRHGDAYRLATPTTPRLTINARVQDFTVRQLALFGELSYLVTEKLKATVGARTFEYDQEFVTTSFVSASPSTTTLVNKNKSGETYKLHLTYKPSAESLLYAQWAEGFRLGVPLTPPPAAVCDLNGDGLIDGTNLSVLDRSLSPDSLDSYEVGAKFGLFNQRLSVRASIFRNDWSGIPVTVLVPCGFGQSVNAGEGRTQGLEFESSMALLDGLSVHIGAGYVDAKLTKDAPGVGLKGDRLPGSPRYNVAAGVQYQFAMADLPSFVRADYLKVGGFHNNLAGTGTEIGDYDLINLRVGLVLGRVELEVFANNLMNTTGLTWVDSVFAGVDARASRVRPRTAGLSAGYRF